MKDGKQRTESKDGHGGGQGSEIAGHRNGGRRSTDGEKRAFIIKERADRDMIQGRGRENSALALQRK